LKERGITVDDLKSDLRRQQSITKLMNHEVVAKISISDQDIADFLQREQTAIQCCGTAVPHRADCRHSAQGTGDSEPQKRRRHKRSGSEPQSENAHGTA